MQFPQVPFFTWLFYRRAASRFHQGAPGTTADSKPRPNVSAHGTREALSSCKPLRRRTREDFFFISA